MVPKTIVNLNSQSTIPLKGAGDSDDEEDLSRNEISELVTRYLQNPSSEVSCRAEVCAWNEKGRFLQILECSNVIWDDTGVRKKVILTFFPPPQRDSILFFYGWGNLHSWTKLRLQTPEGSKLLVKGEMFFKTKRDAGHQEFSSLCGRVRVFARDLISEEETQLIENQDLARTLSYLFKTQKLEFHINY